MADELHEPLGLTRPGPDNPSGRAGNSSFRTLSLRTTALWALGAVIAGGSFYVARFGDPHGGVPRVVARIEQVVPAKPAAPSVDPGRDMQATGSVEAHQSDRQTGQEIERNSGVKVTRAGGADAPGALIIQLDQPSGVHLTPAPDQRLVERDKLGLLPRIGADGSRASEIYARPVALSPKLKAGAPRIAFIVGGVGLSPTTTQDAMAQLPGEISFAFAPYGADLAAEVSRARDAGHEVFLQAPMEPFDYPQNNPGAHTLLSNAAPADAATDMRWLMSRFTGYVGLVNFLGARFMSTDSAVTPFMREMSSRGLAFIDDGTSPQSLATNIAGGMGVTNARVDIVVDADGKPEATEAALTKLEAIARQRGFALGMASAIPQSIERVARFARGLEGRGVALVPASAALSTARGPQVESRRP